MGREHRHGDDYRRIDLILGLANQGLKFDQVDVRLASLDLKRRLGIEANQKGATNEAKVARLLMSAPYVDHIERTNPFSPEDMAGYDLYAYLSGMVFLDSVGVQVKSSEKGVNKFLRQRTGVTPSNKGGVNRWLYDRRLVMINGSHTDREIIDSFVGQIVEMDQRIGFDSSRRARR